MKDLERRSFLGIVGAALPAALVGQGQAPPPRVAVPVREGDDRFGAHQGLGISTIDFKLGSGDTDGNLLVIENTNRAKGGPARHMHYEQDEWFHVLDGAYVIEIGQDRFQLAKGDSVLAPRRIPHVWAYAGDGTGKLLISFSPAGKMEAFFREVSKMGAMPPQDPALWRAHGMELLGPPLKV